MADRNSIQAGRAHVTLGVDRGPLDRGLEAARASFEAWGKGIAALGAVIAAQGAVVAAPFLKGLSVFADWGLEMRNAIRMTGIEFGQLEAIMHGTRTDIDQITAATRKMSQAITQELTAPAGGGRGARGAAHVSWLERLGISREQINELDQGDRLVLIADRIDRIGDASQRLAAQQHFFGRSGLQLNIEGGAAGIRARAARREEVQGVRTEADLEAAKNYNAAVKEMGQATQGVWFALGAAAAPVMQKHWEMVTNIIIEVRKWVEASRPLLTIIFSVADKAVLAGTAIGLLGGTIYGVSYALAFIGGALKIVGGGFGLVSLAAGAWSAAVSIASGIASGAMGVASFLVGALTSGFGLLTVAGWFYSAGSAAWSAITWLFTAAAGVATGATGGYTLALIGAWIWENIASLGATLLVTALGAVVIAAGAVVLAFGGFLLLGAAIAGIGVAAAFLAEMFLPLLAEIDGFAEVMNAVGEAWDAVADSPFGSMLLAVGDALAWVRDNAMAVWDAIMQWLESSGILTFLGYVFKVAVGVAALGAAILGVAGYLAYWVATSGAVRDAITKVWEVVKFLASAWWEGVKAIAAFVGYVSGASETMQRLAGTGGEVLSSLGRMAGSLRDAFGRAFRTIASAASSTFSGLVDVVGNSWRSIWEAIKSGDWTMAFEQVKAAGAIAWAHIKFLGLTTFYAIKDAVMDAFGDVGRELRALFRIIFADMQAAALDAAAAAAQSIGMDERARGLALDARRIRGNARRNAEEIRAGRAPLDENDDERRARLGDEQRAREEIERRRLRDRDLAGDRDRDVLAANQRLQVLQAAQRATAILGLSMSLLYGQSGAGAPRRPGDGFEDAVRRVSAGTFSAAEARGFLGATSFGTGETRQEAIARQHRDIAAQELALLREIARRRGLVML